MKTTDEVRHQPRRRGVYRRFVAAWLLGWVLLAWSCQPSTDEKPDNLIPEDKMAQVLTDIHLAEAKVTKMGLSSSDSLNLLYKRMEKQIYARYKLDTATYTRSYIYYSSHPEQLAAIYKQVVANLEEKKKTKKP